MKFLADMGISHRTVLFLGQSGHDATHLHDEALGELPDDQIIQKARAENRILLTHDLDFGELMAYNGEMLPSVITFRLRDMTPQSVNQHLSLILDEHSERLERGAMMSVTENRIRIRDLPIMR